MRQSCSACQAYSTTQSYATALLSKPKLETKHHPAHTHLGLSPTSTVLLGLPSSSHSQYLTAAFPTSHLPPSYPATFRRTFSDKYASTDSTLSVSVTCLAPSFAAKMPVAPQPLPSSRSVRDCNNGWLAISTWAAVWVRAHTRAPKPSPSVPCWMWRTWGP